MPETTHTTDSNGNTHSAGNNGNSGNTASGDGTAPLWWNSQTVYWQANQVAITFHSALTIAHGLEQIVSMLRLDHLNRFLNMNGFNLQSFTRRDVPRTPETGRDEHEKIEAKEEEEKRQDSAKVPLNSTVGKYAFRSPSGAGSVVVCFFHSESTGNTSSLSDMRAMKGGNGQAVSHTDTTRDVVTHINQNLDKLRHDGNIPVIAAMPNWVGGGTNGVGNDSGVAHGCPITPPIPVPGSEACAGQPGRYPISLPELSETMQGMTGEGVHVFVLDTVPKVDAIVNAAASAENNNLALAEMVTAIEAGTMVIGDQSVPDDIKTSIRTGKDVYGRLFGFDMPDHGLFVAGIIHDLAPDARIECMRVLNDYGIGTFATVCNALQNIQARMLGDNGLKQVVINLSLVVTPADEELAGLWYGDGCCYHAGDIASILNEVRLLRAGLHMVIQSLTSLGAVVVASAGNDSNADAQYIAMNTGMSMGSGMPLRFGPRYPAAFPEVISVGAVYKNGQAAGYSNYPALPPNHNGIATHGGGRPQVAPPGMAHPAGSKTWATVSDGIIGVFSNTSYPMLSATDAPPTDYPVPADNYGWAYWAGTSFATPVISALAARVVQARRENAIPSTSSVQDTLTTASGQKAILPGGVMLNNNTDFGYNVTVLRAEQCQPGSTEMVVSGSGHAAAKNM